MKLDIEKIKKIDGLVHGKELRWLYEKAQEMENIVEIGCYKGLSTFALLSGCPGTVWAVDHFKGTENDPEIERGFYEEFIYNVGHFPNLRVLSLSSEGASDWFDANNMRVDMTWIDGDHSYEAIKKDIEMWLPKTRKLICGHDYGDNETEIKKVKTVVNEMFDDFEVYMNIWFKYL